MDARETCPGQNGNITQYKISFQTQSLVKTENVNITSCTAGQCSHTFQPPSNPPSSYDHVSVAAENVVGVGGTRSCITQPISELSVVFDSMHVESLGGLMSPVVIPALGR